MAMFNWLQKKIAYALLEESLSLEELAKAIGENPLDTEKALKEMLALKVVNESSGLFSLSEEVKAEFRKKQEIREQAKPKLELQAYIEARGLSKKAVLEQMKHIEESLKKQQAIVLYSISHAEPEKQGELYTGHIELAFGVKSFTALVQLMYFYAPSAIEVIRPAKAEFTAFDLQEALNEMAEFIFKYNAYIARNLKKAEIDAFYKELFQGNQK